jgi:hypothetical protein
LNIFNVEWKLNIDKIHELQRYITIYARIPVADAATAEQASQLSFTQWLPRWWQHLYIVDKLLLGLTVVLLLFTLLTIPKQIRFYNSRHLILLATALTGSLVWWLNAPDPRFGTGFLIPLIYVLSIGAVRTMPFFKRPVPSAFFRLGLNAVTVALLMYTTYRLICFFDGAPFLFPTGVKEVAYTPVSCQGIIFSLAKKPNETGFAPPPCVQDSCRQWVPRGSDLRAGFKARK